MSLLHFNVKYFRVICMYSCSMIRHTSQLCEFTIATWFLWKRIIYLQYLRKYHAVVYIFISTIYLFYYNCK